MKRLLTALLVCSSSLALAQSSMEQESKGHHGEQNVYNVKQSFEIDGTLSKVKGKEVTISRQAQNLPDVRLDVRDSTRFLLDGRQVSKEQLAAGIPVRARFQLDGDNIVAVEVDAMSRHRAPKPQPLPPQQESEPQGGQE